MITNTLSLMESSSRYNNKTINNHNVATTSTTTTSIIRQQQSKLLISLLPSSFYFLPDFTEHPKPKVIKRHNNDYEIEKSFDNIPPEEDDITFFHDFIAGGVAGSASVVVGHPFDTIKVRMQTSVVTSGGFRSTLNEFGGISSLFRGMSAPLCTAAFVNAIIFGSYGLSSRIYNDYYSVPIYNELYDDDDNNNNIPTHDPWKKSMICGSFAGLMQAFIICPMEHVKCRLQTQQSNSMSNYTGSFQATKSIIKEYGIQRLFQGWWSTIWREVPAFGIYFASYDYMKDIANDYLAENMNVKHYNQQTTDNNELDSSTSTVSYSKNKNDHSHTWLASAFSGGCAGCLTWILIYPFDVIKTRIQTSSLTTPFHELTIYKIGSDIVRQHGYKYLFRGLGVTLIRAFPVNGTIFPVYEFTLKQVRTFTDTSR